MTPTERSAFIKEVTEAIQATQSTSPLSDDERRWVRLAIKREAQSVAVRQSIIEKTLSALALAAISWIGFAIVTAAKSWVNSKTP
jgi:hypothetical protein